MKQASGGWRVQSSSCASSRWPRPTRLANASGSVVAITRAEAAPPAAPETPHARPPNGPIHDKTSLDVRGSEFAGCSLRARREQDPAGAEGVAPVQGAARRHRPYAN